MKLALLFAALLSSQVSAETTTATSTTPATPPPAAPSAQADQPPDSEVFLASLDISRRLVGVPRNISNHPGYDNQPAFLHNGKALLFVSDRSGSTDVYRHDLRSGQTTQLTHTAEGEFSPTPLPGDRAFSVIRIAQAGPQGADMVNPPVWRYGMDGKPERKLSGVLGVGYHAWLDSHRLAVFVVGDPDKKVANELRLVDLRTGKSIALSSAPGRQLGRTPDGKRVSYVDQSDPAHWRVVAKAPDDAAPVFLVDTPQGPAGEKEEDRSEDYCWLPDGSLLMAKGRQLLRWDGKPGTGLKPFADVDLPAGDIKRLAVSRDGNHLAFVVQTRN